MNDVLRERLMRKLDTLPEERVYQIFDYIDFLESKYARRPETNPGPLKRFAEGMEDTLRAGRVSATAIAGTMNIMNKAVGAIGEVAAAGRSVATGLIDVASTVTRPVTTREGASGPAHASQQTQSAQPAAHPTQPVPQQPVHPRAGPHELGSQLPHNNTENRS